MTRSAVSRVLLLAATQEAGTLGQPMRGPLGWYVTRLIYRSEPSLLVLVSEESLRAQTLEDYLSWNLMAYAQDLIQRNEVHGLEIPGNPPWPTVPTRASPK